MEHKVMKVNEAKAPNFIMFLTRINMVDDIVTIIRHDGDPMLEYTIDITGKEYQEKMLQMAEDNKDFA